MTFNQYIRIPDRLWISISILRLARHLGYAQKASLSAIVDFMLLKLNLKYINE